MSNYSDSNLISIPSSNVPAGTLAMKIGNNIFTAGNVIISSGTDISSTTAVANKVLSGYLFYDSAGAETTGTIPIISGGTITPATSDQIISSGVYLGGSQVILGDAALVASNIVSGASIFGVSGTATAGGGASLVDLIKVTSYTAFVPQIHVPEIYSLSGMTSAANPWDESEPGMDFSVLNGTYTVTSDTAAVKAQLARVYKHDSANYFLRHYSDEYQNYWLLGSTADTTVWDSMLVLSTDQPLQSGTQSWNNMNWDMSQSVTVAIVSNTTFPAVPMTLAGQKITSIVESAYDSTRGVRTYTPNGTDSTFSAADETPVVSGLALISGGRMLMHMRNTCVQTYGKFSSGVSIAEGSPSVSSGWLYLSTFLSGGQAYLNVLSGGTAYLTTVGRYATMNISSGGIADNTTIVDGGGLRVSSGGIVSSTTVSNGSIGLQSGGSTDQTTVSNGTLVISSGGVGNNTVVTYAGGISISGGTGVNVTISSGGTGTVYANGYLDSCIVSEGGRIDIDAPTDHVTVKSGGTVIIRGGAVMSNAVIEEGAIELNY